MARMISRSSNEAKLQLKKIAIKSLMGDSRNIYDSNQFGTLAANVAEIRALDGLTEPRTYFNAAGMGAQLSSSEKDALFEIVHDLIADGFLREGLNRDNPRFPFFRLTEKGFNEFSGRGDIAGDSKMSGEVRQEKSVVQSDPVKHSKNHPTVFISYSWDDEAHKNWVKILAEQLRSDGIETILDQWELAPGDPQQQFMEKAIVENDFVLIICTEKYKVKSNGRSGGVGYEGHIMTAEVYAKGNHRKYIPIIRSGNFATAIPTWISGKYGINLSGNPYSQTEYRDLLATLHNAREQAPPVGSRPTNLQGGPTLREAAREFFETKESAGQEFEPIKITGILVDEVGDPINDGTRGSALYRVPFKLNRAPTTEWSNSFVRTWEHPPASTTRHRRGIAIVERDKIVLSRTTIEEVNEVHRDTLKLVMDTVNNEMAEIVRQRNNSAGIAASDWERHRENIKRIADEMKFD